MRSGMMYLWAAGSAMAWASLAAPAGLAQPVSSPWNGPALGGGAATLVATAGLAGWQLAAGSDGRLRAVDVRGEVVWAAEPANVTALAPWLTLGPGGAARVVGAAMSESGRLGFVAIAQSGLAPDSQPRGTLLRWDTSTGSLGVFARVELGDGTSAAPLAHFGGRLLAGTPAGLRIYRANANDTTGTLLGSDANVFRSLSVDRERGQWHGLRSDGTLVRAGSVLVPPNWVTVGNLPGGPTAAAAFSDTAGRGQGLYHTVVDGADPAAAVQMRFIPANQMRGEAAFAPVIYGRVNVSQTSIGPTGVTLAAGAEGTLVASGATAPVAVRDAADTRLSLQAWMRSELTQQVAFARSLITGPASPGGSGWVIDADTQIGLTRFHPASPDAAAWTVLLLLAAHDVLDDPAAQADVRRVLLRHAGLAFPGSEPQRNPDGWFLHWIEPATGGQKSGWGDGFATLSTMKIVLAAARAAQMFPEDAQIQAAAREIVCRVRNHDAFLQLPGGYFMLAQPAGGPITTSRSAAFNEGLLFAEQAGVYGGPTGATASANWFNRALWPTATWLSGRPITGDVAGAFLPAFVSIYPALLSERYRASSDWSAHMANLRASSAAWTDDNRPRWYTVFSAGTTRSDWGGYHADALGDSPGNVSTFTAVMGVSAMSGAANGDAEIVGAYNAFLRGARQPFTGGASILYRRSSIDAAYVPNSAGLPDVAMGGLALAARLDSTFTDRVLAKTYWACPRCVADIVSVGGLPPTDGLITGDDFNAFIGAFAAGAPLADVVGIGGLPGSDGLITGDDFNAFIAAFAGGCP